MATIELEPVVDDTVENDNHDEQRIIHLHWFNDPKTACGAARNEWHRGIHSQTIRWKRGMLACPVCNIPICLDCVLVASNNMYPKGEQQ